MKSHLIMPWSSWLISQDTLGSGSGHKPWRVRFDGRLLITATGNLLYKSEGVNYVSVEWTCFSLTLKCAHCTFFASTIQTFICSCGHSDCEAESAPAAAGGRKQGTLQARGDSVLSHHHVLAHQHLDLAPPLRCENTWVSQNTWSTRNVLLKVQP